MSDHPTTSAAAFAQIFAHRAMLRAFVHAVVRDPAIVEDVLSEAALAIATSYPKYDPALPFPPWARTITYRVAIDHLRKRGRVEIALPTEVLDYIGADFDSQANQARLDHRKELLRACLEKLNPRYRQLVALRYFEHLQPEIIAAKVNRSLSALYTVYSRIHTALHRCVSESEAA